jgi:L-alanine-DL-glutamate epimerase-like enolase superfamily enzyme
MLRQVTSQIERWPLANPFRISRGVRTVAELVTVEIGEGSLRGRGETMPYARYGETLESVVQQIEAVGPALETGADRTELSTLLPPGAARQAVDCALWDLEAKLTGTSVAERLGRPLRPVATALTVSLDEPQKMGEAGLALAGARLVKVKLGPDEPEACLRAVRQSAPHVRMIVDANEGWNIALLERLQPVLQELCIDFIEQPLPAGEDHALEGFEPLVPICADESCHTRADLDMLARRYSMINIKLGKTGGLTEALALLEAGRERGFGTMVGCMISTSLSIAPAMHVAAMADYADLDGPLWLREDHERGVRLENGQIMPPAPGFWG